VAVRAGAHAAGAHLDAEQVVQEPGGEVVVKIAEDHAEDAEAPRPEVSKDEEIVAVPPFPERPLRMAS